MPHLVLHGVSVNVEIFERPLHLGEQTLTLILTRRVMMEQSYLIGIAFMLFNNDFLIISLKQPTA